MKDALPCFAIGAFFVFGLVMTVWHYSRASDLVERWAQRNRYRILDRELRPLRRGPFWWRTTKGQEVYRVTVQDAGGNVRSGYVRCGSWAFGVLSDRVDVAWDQEPTYQPGFPVVPQWHESRDV
jgi:hypothetical protein